MNTSTASTVSSPKGVSIMSCGFLSRMLKNPPACKNFVLPGSRSCKPCEKQAAKEHALVEERRRQGFCKNLWCNNETRGHAACSKCHYDENPHQKVEVKAVVTSQCSDPDCSETSLGNGWCPKHQPKKSESELKATTPVVAKPAAKPWVKPCLCKGCRTNDEPTPGQLCRMCAPPKSAQASKSTPAPEALKCERCFKSEPTPGHKQCKRCYIRWSVESDRGVSMKDMQSVEYIDVLETLGKISKEVADNLRQQLTMPVATPVASTPTAKPVTLTARQKFESEVKATFAKLGYKVSALREAYKSSSVEEKNGCVLFVTEVGDQKMSFTLYPPKAAKNSKR